MRKFVTVNDGLFTMTNSDTDSKSKKVIIDVNVTKIGDERVRTHPYFIYWIGVRIGAGRGQYEEVAEPKE